MKKRKTLLPFIILMAAALIVGCENESASTGTVDTSGDGWLLPQGAIYSGGPGKDGIPALSDPQFQSASSANYADDDLVIGVKFGEDVRAYPHIILDWHEIINDKVNGRAISITYCPLTGSGIGWNRRLTAGKTTFGVSGLLYNNNLIPYDRATESHWSQMKLQGVEGQLAGKKADLYRVVETEWGTWKENFPSTKVMTTNTGYDRPYGNYPYGGYKENHQSIYFPVTHSDSRMKAKVRVLGLLTAGKAVAFRIADFPPTLTVLNETYNGSPYVIIGNSRENFAVAYKRLAEDGTVLHFQPEYDQGSIVMKDSSGTKWNLLGRAVSGPLAGEELPVTRSYIAYWFAWAAFNPDTRIYSF